MAVCKTVDIKKVRWFCRVVQFLYVPLIFCATIFAQDAEELQRYTTKLTETSRVSGSEECTKAADYIKSELNMYNVEFQRFTYNNWTAANIIATKVGGSKVIVVGAHYDSVANSPGADDNASGTAAVIGLAKRFEKIKTRHTLAFQFYSGEEQYLIGSQFYVKNPKWPIKDHIFMLNLDMIGYLQQQPGDLPFNPGDLLKPLYEKYAFARSITKRESPDSDQASFHKIGIPVVFLTTGLHRHYHKKTDTANRLNYPGMAEICNYAYDLLIAVDKHDIPRYNIIE